jgi:hypothetical protein
MRFSLFAGENFEIAIIRGVTFGNWADEQLLFLIVKLKSKEETL